MILRKKRKIFLHHNKKIHIFFQIQIIINILMTDALWKVAQKSTFGICLISRISVNKKSKLAVIQRKLLQILMFCSFCGPDNTTQSVWIFHFIWDCIMLTWLNEPWGSNTIIRHTFMNSKSKTKTCFKDITKKEKNNVI